MTVPPSPCRYVPIIRIVTTAAPPRCGSQVQASLPDQHQVVQEPGILRCPITCGRERSSKVLARNDSSICRRPIVSRASCTGSAQLQPREDDGRSDKDPHEESPRVGVETITDDVRDHPDERAHGEREQEREDAARDRGHHEHHDDAAFGDREEREHLHPQADDVEAPVSEERFFRDGRSDPLQKSAGVCGGPMPRVGTLPVAVFGRGVRVALAVRAGLELV